jgi:hypothetical protein
LSLSQNPVGLGKALEKAVQARFFPLNSEEFRILAGKNPMIEEIQGSCSKTEVFEQLQTANNK